MAAECQWVSETVNNTRRTQMKSNLAKNYMEQLNQYVTMIEVLRGKF